MRTQPIDTNRLVPFTWTTEDLVLAANSRNTISLNLTSDASFEWHMLCAATSSDDDTADQQPNYFSAQIKDESTGRYFTSDFVQQANLCGSAFNGMLLGRPLTIAPLTILSFDVQNLTGGSLTVAFSLTGYKILL
jgi:hypothetical protein